MSFWRKQDPVLKDGKVITGGMWPHQREWWNSDKFIKALVTGYGGGKTLIGAKRAIAIALNNAPAPHMSVSPSYKLAKRTTIPTIRKLLEGRKIPYSFNKSDHEFKIKYRGRQATIWIGSGDDPEALKGPNLGSASIDEPFIQDKAVFEQMIARVRDPDAKLHEITLTGTPEQLNWGYDICEGEEKKNYSIDLIQASTRANKALTSEYYKRMANGYTPEMLEAFGEGQFVNMAQGLIYYAFDLNKNVVDYELPSDIQIRVGMDFNVNPMCAVLFWQYEDHIHIFEEIQLPNANTKLMCDEIRMRYGDRPVYVYPDSSGGSRKTSASIGITDHSILEENGFFVECHNSNPPVRDRENAVNGAFYHGRLTISSDCPKLKSALLQYDAQNRNKEQGKKLSHPIDAMGYPVEFLMPIEAGSRRAPLGGY